MTYSPVPTVATGDLWTASNHNTYIRDNFAAGVPGLFTTKGDMAVASASQIAARLGIGSNGQVLTPDSGQTLGMKWAGFPTWGEWVNTSWDGDAKNIGNYTVNASDWTGIPASGVGGILLGIQCKWTNADIGNLLYAKKLSSSKNYLTVRSHIANQPFDAMGLVPLVNGQFELQVLRENALEVWVTIYGYYPG